MSPIAVQPPPPPDPLPMAEPWTWTVAQLGPHLTESQRQTLLARFRALGFNASTWPT